MFFLFGQSNSKKTYHNNQVQDEIVLNIHQRAKKLTEQYNNLFLDPDFCKKITLVYNDQLNKFRKQEINGVQYTLGVKVEDPELNKQACQIIVEHYLKQIKLIAKIDSSIDYCLHKIRALTVGPRCNGFPDSHQMEECRQKGGQWIETILLPDDQLVENKPWYQQVHDMQTEYIGILKKLESVLRQLEDFDDYINDEKLDSLDSQVDQMIQTITITTFERYRMILATQTYTAQQIREKKMREATIQNNYSAQQSALRVANGLPPTRLR